MGDNRYPEIPLWPEGGVPDEPENIKEREKPTTVDSVGKMRIAYVDRPTLTVYPTQKEKPTELELSFVLVADTTY